MDFSYADRATQFPVPSPTQSNPENPKPLGLFIPDWQTTVPAPAPGNADWLIANSFSRASLPLAQSKDLSQRLVTTMAMMFVLYFSSEDRSTL